MKEQIKIHLVAGARPNFMKIAPLYHCLKDEDWCEPILIHTGQHYDNLLSDTFFKDFSLPEPHFKLDTGSGTHAQQTAQVMVLYEKICMEHRPECVVVVGDVNSTFAATLAAKKLNLTVAHLEAGLRSFDRSMPEEINRILTDAIADIHWTPSQDANENLKREGIEGSGVRFVGNIMLDAYEFLKPQIEKNQILKEIGVEDQDYGVVTLHRPSNTEDLEKLSFIVNQLKAIGKNLRLVFPVHPRTEKKLKEANLWEELGPNILVEKPLSYIPFLRLVKSAALVITDSGGLQEETTYLGVRCFTLREQTERPVTLSGTNVLVNPHSLLEKVEENLKADTANKKPELWDGHTAERIKKHLKELFCDYK